MQNCIVHAILTPYASGNVQMDVLNPMDDNMGGGCRAAFMGLVQQLPQYGHTVRAFSTFKRAVSMDGVDYLPFEDLNKYGCPNVAWATYDTRILSGMYGMLRIGSHHTYHVHLGSFAPFDSIDVNTVPSQASLDVIKPFWYPRGQWRVLPNAVGEVPEWKPVPGRVIYHTSPGRGLHLLTLAWPYIKERVPHATLHIIGNCDEWMKLMLSSRHMENSEEARRARSLQSGLEKARAVGGVTCMTGISRTRMWEELSQASVFAFPCSVMVPTETFSVCIMECCKIGIPVVLSPVDALESIYKDHVLMTRSPIEENGNIFEFVEAVVKVLKYEETSRYYSMMGKELASQYTYERAGKVLSDIICENTGFIPKNL